MCLGSGLALASACAAPQASSSICGDGFEASAAGGTYCVYRGNLTGIACPPEAPYAYPIGEYLVCSPHDTTTQDLLVALSAAADASISEPGVTCSEGDFDADGLCDGSDDDLDGDGVSNPDDQCLGLDELGDLDADGHCSDIDSDDDGDGVEDENDICLGADTEGDTDGDGLCDGSDEDLDGDGVSNPEDQCLGPDELGDPDGDGMCGTAP
jgi:hypothetical protein